jgi:hypothetical protein
MSPTRCAYSDNPEVRQSLLNMLAEKLRILEVIAEALQNIPTWSLVVLGGSCHTFAPSRERLRHRSLLSQGVAILDGTSAICRKQDLNAEAVRVDLSRSNPMEWTKLWRGRSSTGKMEVGPRARVDGNPIYFLAKMLMYFKGFKLIARLLLSL